MRKNLIFALMALGILATACNEKDVIYDMARFDRAYVPALALTEEKDSTGQSVLAVKRLKQDWAVLSGKYAQVLALDGASEDINRNLDRADMLITTGDFRGAHKELEPIGSILLRARKKHGIDYFMDYMTAFHSSLERAVAILDNRVPATLTEEDVSVISGLLPDIRTRWNAVAEAPFDRTAFLFDKETETSLRSALAEEAKAIDNMDAALRSGNHKLIFKHALLLREGYQRVFRMFGNFESVSI